MLGTILIILFFLWLLGYVAPFSPVQGNNILHLLLVLFVIIIICEYVLGIHLFNGHSHWHRY